MCLAHNLQNADLGNLWALLDSATANVKTATVAKLECIYCKGSHQVQNCQELFKAIESGRKNARNEKSNRSTIKPKLSALPIPILANYQNNMNQGYMGPRNNYNPQNSFSDFNYNRY